ncbi:hypothetical protein [Cupriavidus pinatubonensis]|uniref:Uncharacterized protein n=1 Tax=Cupriavidus pinatubonensis TaxID=248026 RepID=A0ABN7Y5Y9_9BURK|nr:hypothetical protein [Cupriavidus pinatubonensis]CAG9168778.1 hypothetical protein LMG23994_01422 [Cupriavidus pinatubonensis]
MFEFCSRRIKATAVAVFGLAAAGTAQAASEDVFLRAEPTTGEFTSFRAEGSFDAVNKALDVFNLRNQGGSGPTPDNAGDYRGGRVMLGYKFSPYFSGAATYLRRNIDYGQDTNSIDTWQLALHYDPLAEPGAKDRLIFRFSLWGDRAGSVSKTSPTQVRGTSFSQIQVNDPNDFQAQADMIFSGQLSERSTLTGFLGGGFSNVSVGDLSAQVRRGNCNFNVKIGSDNIANGSLAAPCSVNGSQIRDASFSVNASQFGLDVSKDLNYTAAFLTTGVSWRWKYERFSTQLGYNFQYLFRSNIDDRLSSFGVSPIKSNHTLGLELAYSVTKSVEFYLRGQAFKYNFVGTIPFLYNAATAGRMDRYYGYGSIGVRFSGF